MLASAEEHGRRDVSTGPVALRRRWRGTRLHSFPSREANEHGDELKQGRKKKAGRKRDAGSRVLHGTRSGGATGLVPTMATPTGSGGPAGSHGRGNGDQARCVGWSGMQDEGDGRRGFGSWVRALLVGNRGRQGSMDSVEQVERWLARDGSRGRWWRRSGKDGTSFLKFRVGLFI